MARGGGVGEWARGGGGGGLKFCSYKRTTILVCFMNLVAALYLLRSIYTSFYFFSPSSSLASSSNVVKFTEDQIRTMEESISLRKASEPIQLIKLVKQLEVELTREGWELSQPMKQKLTNEILQRLKGLKPNASETEQREVLEMWRAEKLEEAKKSSLENATFNSTIPAPEAKMLTRALESDWLVLLEEIGFWMPAEVVNKENSDKPENEIEEEVIPGRPMLPECHPELHTDYDGVAVRWGLTHHKESAADCCQACLDQAKLAKPGERKCNIWVYCASETGCFSPDIYEHKHQECWLKQAEVPKLNFKDTYSESYRSSHPTAPLIVPWMSGVIGA